MSNIKDTFTPERLLGVETNVGFITECQICSDDKLRVLTGDGGLWYWELKNLKFYISDVSDETVSFDEYIKLFYNTEDTL